MSGFQTAEEFEKENAHLIKQQEDTEARRNAPPLKQSRKKKRQEVDAESLRIERDATEETGMTNWAGRLLEYRGAHPIAEGLQYLEQIVDHLVTNRYTVMVLIAESPIQFGTDISFTNKKTAKQYASKKAIDWLIEHKHMPPGGAVKWPKTSAQAPPQKAATPANPDSPPPFIPITTSYASQVPNLCTLLGYNIPRYVIEPIAPGVAVYDCWADFGGEPEIEGKVGEFKSIHGKKAAKEMVAKEVLSFLKSIERQRRGSEDEGSQRKRSFGAPSSSPEVPGEVLKV